MTDPRPKNEAPARLDRALRVLLPIAVLALVVALWEVVVRVGNIPPYVLPSPQLIFSTLLSDWAMLSAALLVTLTPERGQPRVQRVRDGATVFDGLKPGAYTIDVTAMDASAPVAPVSADVLVWA